jgi:hypothetical protein
MSDRLALCKRWINLLVLPAFYLGIAVGTTWPLAARLTSHLPGGTTDTLVHYWNGWWAEQALSAAQSPFRSAYLYHPTGLSLVYHNFAWNSIVPWLALKSWLGGFAAYNALILVNLALCGLAAFLLAYRMIGDKRAALLAGLIYQCWPLRLSQLDHPNLISTQWIPLFLLFLARVVRQGRRRDGVCAGLFLALVGYTRWQQLIPAAIMGSVYLLCVLPSHWASRRRWMPALLLAGVVALLALAPPMLLLINQQRTAPADVLEEGDETLFQTDLMAYVTPGGNHPLLGALTQPAYDRYYASRHAERRFSAYVGLTVLILALLGMWRARTRRASRPWAVMALVLLSLALGPTLRVNGQLYPAVPMPYRLAARTFVVRLLRVPDRYNMFLALPTAMLAARGVTVVLARLQRRGRRATLAASCLLAGAILFEYLVIPVPLQQPQVSPFYEQLAAEPGDLAVLNLPRDTQESKRYMFDQTTHQHAILQGKTARFPRGTFDYLDAQPWLGTLRQSSMTPPAHTDVSRQLATLAQDGVRYIILHKTSRLDVRLAHWRRYFLIAPYFEDDLIAVYPTAPLAGRDFALAHELAPGIGPLRVITSTACLNPGRVLEVDVGWGATAPPGQDLSVELALLDDGGIVRQEQVFALSPGWPTQEWPANALAWGYYTLRATPSLPGGDYTLTLTLLNAETGEAQRRALPVGRITVSESACAFPLATDVVGVHALFGDDLRLLGYQLHRDGQELTLTLHWRSERRMGSDYKVFVHVFDPASGARVAQDDAMPLRWTYPTTLWEPGETVRDAIPLALDGVAAGDYRVVVGVYDAATAERLPALGEDGQPLPDAQVILPETVQVQAPGP